MSKFLKKKSSLRMLACVMAFCMCLTVFAGAASFSASASEATNVWDGTDDYADLAAVLADLGDADADGYYHIKTPNQLHAVIKYNGGGNKYKLDNDIYLNENYQDYATWGTTAPANQWSFNSPYYYKAGYKFNGTIDGCGYTVYGLYSNGGAANNGLIGQTTGTTAIKNLNVWYSYVKASSRVAGVIVGTVWDATSTTIEGCSVRYAQVDVAAGNTAFGGIVGLVRKYHTIISYCSVADVTINASYAKGKTENNYGAINSIVGASYDGNGGKTGKELHKDQARYCKILNSYAVNVINTAENAPVYVAGVFKDTGWGNSISAYNVYTDATKVSCANDTAIKLYVSLDGDNAVAANNVNYPIRTITADSIKGSNAEKAMPLFSWVFWNVTGNDYPYYVDNTVETNVWDGTSYDEVYADISALIADLGDADTDGYYHVKTPVQLQAVIGFSGGGYKYKLDNDIVLNKNYKNYASWGYTRNAPTNIWQFNTNNWYSPSNSFNGTIDGCGHTVYGLYSNTTGHYNGLIGAAGNGSVIKNLNVWCTYLNGYNKAGVIVGCSYPGTLTIDGCSVKSASVEGADENKVVGGIVGMSIKTTTITNCSVTNVKFTGKTPKANAAEKKNPYAFGSIIGGVYKNMREASACGSMQYDQAKTTIIKNSYALNVVNASYDNQPVYVCGLFHDGSEPKWGNCVTAIDVYTDAPAVPESNTDPVVKLFVSNDGEAIKNTIKKPAVDNFAGLFNSGAWYMGAGLPIQKSKTANFNYVDITGEGIDDAYNSVDLIYVRKNLLGVEGYEYILGDLHVDGVINLKDLVALKKNISGK